MKLYLVKPGEVWPTEDTIGPELRGILLKADSDFLPCPMAATEWSVTDDVRNMLFFPSIDGNADVLVIAYEREGKFRLDYRVRYKSKAPAGDRSDRSNDLKSWWTLDCGQRYVALFQAIRAVTDALREQGYWQDHTPIVASGSWDDLLVDLAELGRK